MKTNEIKRKLLIDSIKNTVLTKINIVLDKKVKDRKKIKNMMNAIEIKIDSIINSGNVVIDKMDFSDEKEFENYILDKSNDLRKLLLNEIDDNSI